MTDTIADLQRRMRDEIAERDWDAVHVQADRRKPLNRRLWLWSRRERVG